MSANSNPPRLVFEVVNVEMKMIPDCGLAVRLVVRRNRRMSVSHVGLLTKDIAGCGDGLRVCARPLHAAAFGQLMSDTFDYRTMRFRTTREQGIE